MPQFWVRAKFYEPFRLGGELWDKVRYPLEGTERNVLGYRVFTVEYEPKDELFVSYFKVYEVTTGFFICKAPKEKSALDKARRLIKITPDFDEQIKQAGPVEDVVEVTAEEALSRLKEKPKGAHVQLQES